MDADEAVRYANTELERVAEQRTAEHGNAQDAAPRRRRREQLGQTDIRLGWESSTTGETMDRHAYIDERLAQIPLFKDLSKKDLRRISGLATRLEEPAGKVLTKEGQQGYEFIIVLEGEVEVRQHGEVIAKRGAGDYFGEIALLDNRPRTATIVADDAGRHRGDRTPRVPRPRRRGTRDRPGGHGDDGAAPRRARRRELTRRAPRARTVNPSALR